MIAAQSGDNLTVRANSRCGNSNINRDGVHLEQLFTNEKYLAPFYYKFMIADVTMSLLQEGMQPKYGILSCLLQAVLFHHMPNTSGSKND